MVIGMQAPRASRTAWQLLGRKGVKDGKGYMEDKAGQMHPAQMIGK